MYAFLCYFFQFYQIKFVSIDVAICYSVHNVEYLETFSEI